MGWIEDGVLDLSVPGGALSCNNPGAAGANFFKVASLVFRISGLPVVVLLWIAQQNVPENETLIPTMRCGRMPLA